MRNNRNPCIVWLGLRTLQCHLGDDGVVIC
jgi:hypothetical protein